MPNWLKTRNARIAIGVAVLFLAAKWLFTPTLSDAYLAFNAPEPEEGQVANALDFWALVQPVVDLGLATLAGIGTVVLALAQWGINLAKGTDDDIDPLPLDDDDDFDLPPEGLSVEEMQHKLMQAIATNDDQAIDELRGELRPAYAINELELAVTAGDLDSVETLIKEVRSLAKINAEAE